MLISNIDSNKAVTEELGRRFKDLRVSAALTQQQLAQRAGVSAGTVSNFERGRDISIESLVSMMRALGVLSRLDMLFPEEMLRPSDQQLLGRKRQRVRQTASKGNSATWKWGDEQ